MVELGASIAPQESAVRRSPGSILRIVDWMLPNVLLENEESRFRSRVLVVCTTSIGIMGSLAYIVRLMTAGPNPPVVAVLLVCFSIPLLVRALKSYRIPGVLFVLAILIAFGAIFWGAGLFPLPHLSFYPLLPIIASFFVGPRIGFACALIGIAQILIMVNINPVADGTQIETLVPMFVALTTASMLMVAVMAWVYETARRRALDQAHRAMDDLRTKNHALRHAQAQAEDANRAKSDFLARMSHELRTPLNSIIGYGEMLGEDLHDEEQSSDVDRIVRSGKHLLSLINEVLDLSKIEAGSMEPQLGDIDLAEFVANVEATVSPLAQAGGNTLRVHHDASAVTMNSDSLRLKQILLNLLGNACKFTENGEIAFTVDRDPAEPTMIRMVVRDTGIGMTPEQLTIAFEPFKQVDESRSRRRDGTGLGLTLTRKLCDLLGGRLRAESQPNVGSTFTLWFPEKIEARAASSLLV